MMERKSVPVDSHYKRVILLHLYEEWKTGGHNKDWRGIDPASLVTKYDEKTQLGLEDTVRNVKDLIERGYAVSKGDPTKQSRQGFPWEFVDIKPQGRKLIETSELDSEFPAKWKTFGTGKLIR